MPSLVLRPHAKEDLAEIWNTIADASIQRADLFVDRVGTLLQTLADQPELGRVRDELAPACAAFRSDGIRSSTKL